jgi:hypothetical protein
MLLLQSSYSDLMVDIQKMLAEQASEIDKIIEKWIPKNYDINTMNFIFGEAKYKHNVDCANKSFAEPIWEFLSRGGKRWRPSLFLMVVEALGGDKNKVFDFVVIPEIIHNGTLLHDDIEDRSELRRGKPCTYILYGLDVAINTGNTMYYLPLLPLIKNRDKFDSKVLDKGFVGRLFDEQFLSELPSNVDPCGENGEFHSFVYDGPLFRERLLYKLGDVVLRDNRFYFCDLIPVRNNIPVVSDTTGFAHQPG